MRRSMLAAVALPLILVLAACSSGGAATSAPTNPPSQPPAIASTTPSTAPSTDAGASAPATGATVEAKPVGAIGTVLVAGSNGMTVYTFTKDVKDNGKSACTGGCATTWPALSVAAGGTPAGGTGVTGTLGTITRDDGSLQVTYNGLPLYFFANDKAPGDANGVYANWEAVKP
jgi:predicted lipoprotein with Yx(FWY)xxD motif